MICDFCKVDKPRTEFGKPPNLTYAPGWWCKRCESNRVMLGKHGVTNDQKRKIAAYNCGCAICGHPEPGTHGWNVDHDRQCCNGSKSCPKCRRGILCGWCNKMLAYAFDRPEILTSAVKYLEAHATGTCDWHKPLACAPRMCNGTEAA